MECPECGAPMTLRETTKYKTKKGLARKFYGCTRYPVCNGTHGAHPDGKPLGVPGDKETKQWRIKAHDALDTLSKKFGYNKADSYKLLQTTMGMNSEKAHIGRFNIEECKTLISRLNK